MDFSITTDADWESRAGRVLSEFFDTSIRKSFARRSYGTSVRAFFVVVMCRRPEVRFPRRTKYEKETRTFYMDAMLDFTTMRDADMPGRRRAFARCVCDDAKLVLAESGSVLKDFDGQRFLTDLEHAFVDAGWLGAPQ